MGEITTFYAYKGGTGRTMALANTAVLLARQTKGRVLMIDWDLEAPGLEEYFNRYIGELKEQKGIFDFVAEAKKTLKKMPYGEEDEELLSAYFKKIERIMLPVNIPGERSNLYLVRAGLTNASYSERINKFSWSNFYKQIPSFFPLFAKFLGERFDYVLIDSRTGHTDIGGICTKSMPDKLVLVFTPNEQSLEGVLRHAVSAAEYRMKYGDLRPLGIYPLPTRVDFNGVTLDKRLYWHEQYRIRWEKAIRQIYALPSTINLIDYFDNVYLRHDSNYAFGEELAVISENGSIESISLDYKRFATYLSYAEIWVDQPFANLVYPYQVFFLFAEVDRPMAEIFFRHIRPLATKQKAIALGQNPKSLLSLDELDDTFRRKIASRGFDFLVLFLSQAFLDQSPKWEFELHEVSNRANGKYSIIPILLEKLNDLNFLEGIQVLPNSRKPIRDSTEWKDTDEAWIKVALACEQRMIVYHEKIRAAKKIFIFYSKWDKIYLEQLRKLLSPLQKDGLLQIWKDSDIMPGEAWDGSIRRELNTADIILLLVSPDLMATDYVWDIEMKEALARHKRGAAVVVPVILRPCLWKDAPFAKLNALPQKGKAISTWSNQEEAWLEVGEKIKEIAERKKM